MSSNGNGLILYQTEDGVSKIYLECSGGTVYLSQAQMAELFDTSKQNIALHLKNIFESGELFENRTVKYSLTVQFENNREVERTIGTYNLQGILAVGYRIRSNRGTQFRRWATTTLYEYLVKGFVMDDQRLKDPDSVDYFDEWLERIRDIRASEKRFHHKIRDILATAVDYDPTLKSTKGFFAKVQNKLLWATTGQTAAELIAQRSDPMLPNAGLTTWAGEKVRKKDVTVAKNYLNEKELKEMNRIVTMLLDYAEDQAEKRITITMAQWSEKIDAFLEFNDRKVLTGSGNIKSTSAQAIAKENYDKFHSKRLKIEKQQAELNDIKELESISKTKGDVRKEGNDE